MTNQLNKDIDDNLRENNNNTNKDMIIKLNHISEKEISEIPKDDKISNKIILKNLNNKNQIQNQKISNIEYHIDQNLNFNIKELNKGNTNENLNKSYNKSINKLYNDLKKNINKKIIHNSFNNNPKKFKKDIF